MLESVSKNDMTYQRLSPEEMKKRGILGRLLGPCADIINPTRNGRKYSESLWEKVFESPLVKEQLEAGGIFGELNHPDYSEVALEKVAIVMPKAPKKDKNGLLIGCWDILDTPAGRILKTLCDYGYKVGISTRGEGDVMEDLDGNESVDPDTYTLNALDIVTIPAVKAARLNYMTEALDKKRYNKTLRQKLVEQLESATDSDRKLMEEVIKTTGLDLTESDKIVNDEKIDAIKDEKVDEEVCKSDSIDVDSIFSEIDEMCQGDYEYAKTLLQHVLDRIESVENDDPERNIKEECNTEECTDKEVQDEAVEDTEATEDTEDTLVNELQEALKAKLESEASVVKLQNKLAVGDAKVKSLEEELTKYKNLSIVLSEKAKGFKDLTGKVKKLQEAINARDEKINKLVESASVKEADHKQLNESIAAKETETKKLVESLQDAKADAELKQAQAEKQLAHTNKLMEAYKKAANETMKMFIESKATMLGVSVSEIRNRLPESYDVNDVNHICEDLQAYQLNISKLPFNVTNMKFKASKKDNLRVENLADEIDDELLEMAKLK